MRHGAVLLLFLLPLADMAAGRTVEIIAHRGASFDAPENTVTAVKLAWEQEADATELDVYLSKDGKVVVIHDEDTERVAGVAKKVVDQSLAELTALDVGQWMDKRFTGEKLPTLKEMLAAIAKGKRVFVEVKCGPEIVPELDRLLRDSGLSAEQTPVISFSEDVVAAVKAARPDLQVYWIVSLKPEEGKAVPSAEALIATARELGADGLDLSADEGLTEAFSRKVKAAGLGLYVWTVNDATVARRMVDFGVDGITTDRPGWLRDQLGQ